MKRFVRILAFAIIAAGPHFSSVVAQPVWVNQSADRMIWIEVLKPDFDGADNTTFLTSAVFASLRYRVGQKVTVVGELPLVHYGEENGSLFGGDVSETSVGNPYIGAELTLPVSPVFLEAGFRPPLTSDNNLLAGLAGTFTDYDRFQAFIPDYFSVLTMANYRYKTPGNFVLRLRTGPIFLFGTETGNESEVLGDYSVQGGLESSVASFYAGLTGRLFLTESGDFGERSVHQLGFSGTVKIARLHPGFLLRFPLDDDLRSIVDFVFGINLGFEFRP